MQVIFSGNSFSIVLDSYESETGAVIELTLEESGKFGVYFRVGPFAYTVEYNDELDAVAAFLAAIEIEEYAKAIRNILAVRFGYALIEYSF